MDQVVQSGSMPWVGDILLLLSPLCKSSIVFETRTDVLKNMGQHNIGSLEGGGGGINPLGQR